jgi:hypothetical protein
MQYTSYEHRYLKFLLTEGFTLGILDYGHFDNEIDAAKAYDEAARELYREYAHLNFG